MEPAPGRRVLDLGAGTGKLTGTLLASGADVTAVEPDPAMLTGLRRELPAVRALPGSATIGPRDPFNSWRAATAGPHLSSEFTLPMLTGGTARPETVNPSKHRRQHPIATPPGRTG